MKKQGFKGTSSGAGLGFGLGLGTINTCTMEDTSFFCQFSRIFQMIMWVFTLLFIGYLIYIFAGPLLFKRRK